jgi:universal stress protein A
MDVVREVFGVAFIFGAVVILLILLNRRDRRASRLRHTVLDQLARPELRGRVGVHIQSAFFSRRRAVSVDLLAGTPHEVWNVFTHMAFRLPPRVRLVVSITPSSRDTRQFGLQTTTGRCSAELGLQDIGGKVMTRILVPTDFSESSLAAVRYSIDLASAGGGVVVLLHVVEGPSVRCYAVGGRPLFLRDMTDLGGEYCRSRFDQQLIRRDFCEEAGWKLDALVPPRWRASVHTVVTAGRAVEEIVRVAKEQHADLILLGAHGQRGWRHMFRRTMADRVRRKALIPVVTLDADDLRVGRDSERWGAPDQQLGSDRAVSHSAELVGVVQDTDGSHRLPRAESTAPSCAAAHDDTETPARPHVARRDGRSGRHAHPRSPASRV